MLRQDSDCTHVYHGFLQPQQGFVSPACGICKSSWQRPDIEEIRLHFELLMDSWVIEKANTII